MERVLNTKDEYDDFFFGKRTLAFLDILGFSDLVKYNTHEAVVDLYKVLVNSPVDTYNDFNKKETEKRKYELGEYANLSGLRIVNISDSILVWTENSKQESIIELLYAVKLLMTVSMQLGIPLRGTVTMGDIEVFENNGRLSIVGKPLVYAAELEKKQKWSGCIVDKGIFNYLRSYEKVVKGKDSLPAIENMTNLVIPYDDLPIDSDDKSGYAVNWLIHKGFTKESIRQSFSKYKKRTNQDTKIQESTEIKIENTIKFFDYCIDKYGS